MESSSLLLFDCSLIKLQINPCTAFPDDSGDDNETFLVANPETFQSKKCNDIEMKKR